MAIRLEDLKPTIQKVADLIEQTIEDHSLIIIRHHADCDGYCGALVLEETILPTIKNINTKPWKKYKRLPMKMPFYDYGDALRDISLFQDSLEFNKKPLLILIDNGCGEEDLPSLKRLKLYNVNIIIIDHHIFSKETDKIVDIHLNPRVFGGAGDMTSGMLAFEVASVIGSPNYIYPALSGIADKSRDEFLEPYIKLFPDKLFLKQLADCVDYEAYHLKFSESNTIYDLFNENQSKTMNIILPEIERRKKEYEEIIKKYLEEFSVGKIKVFKFDIENNVLFSEYPPPGKIIGMAHTSKSGSRITFGIGKDLLVFRVDGLNFSLTNFFSHLRKTIPFGNISGGGHDFAGAIRFIPSVKNLVEEELFKFLKNI